MALGWQIATAGKSGHIQDTLDKDNEEIRVLNMYAGDFDDPIKCVLKTVSLRDRPQYETISYTWGDQKPSRPILIDGKENLITSNLERALRFLRKKDRDIVLWVDAACINQADDVERGHQIILMRRIYRNTCKAHIWLGEFHDGWEDDITTDDFKPTRDWNHGDWKENVKTTAEMSREFSARIPHLDPNPDLGPIKGRGTLDEGVAVMNFLASGKHFYELPCYSPEGNEDALRKWWYAYDVFHWIVSRPWWTRVWTLQEAVLPRKSPILHVGHSEILLWDMLQAVISLHAHEFQSSCCGGFLWALVGCFSRNTSLAARLVNDVALSIVGSRKGTLDVGYVTKMSAERKAKDPRDHFYGIIGLLDDSRWSREYSQPSYHTEVAKVIGEATKLAIQDQGTLIRLSECAGLEEPNPFKLPSWSSDITRSAPAHRYYRFNASGNSRYQKELQLDTLELPVEGRMVDVINWTDCKHITSEKYIRDHGSHQQIVRIVQWHFYRAQAAVERLNGWNSGDDVFWKAMFQDRKPARGSKRRLEATDTDWLRKWFANLQGLERDLWRERMLGLFLDYNNNMRFFCTEGKRAGMARKEILVGDTVWVLKGCPAPVFLRHLDDEGNTPRYAIVGLGYCSGIMDGEEFIGKDLTHVILR